MRFEGLSPHLPEEVDDSAGRGESVALGRGEPDIECGFELVAELDQVKWATFEVPNKGCGGRM